MNFLAKNKLKNGNYIIDSLFKKTQKPSGFPHCKFNKSWLPHNFFSFLNSQSCSLIRLEYSDNCLTVGCYPQVRTKLVFLSAFCNHLKHYLNNNLIFININYFNFILTSDWLHCFSVIELRTWQVQYVRNLNY